METIEKLIISVTVDSCMKEMESTMIEFHKEIKHAARLRAEDKISDKEYITMAAKACSKFVKFIAADTSANCATMAKIREMYLD